MPEAEHILEVAKLLPHMYIVLVIGVDEYYFCKLTLLLIFLKNPISVFGKIQQYFSQILKVKLWNGVGKKKIVVDII